jgi:hypothetical protein
LKERKHMAKAGLGLTAGLRLAGQDNVRNAAVALGALTAAERQVALILAANGALAGSGASEGTLQTAAQRAKLGNRKASRWTPQMRAAQAKRIKAALAKKKRAGAKAGKPKSRKKKAPSKQGEQAPDLARAATRAAAKVEKQETKPPVKATPVKPRPPVKAKRVPPPAPDEELEIDESTGQG